MLCSRSPMTFILLMELPGVDKFDLPGIFCLASFGTNETARLTVPPDFYRCARLTDSGPSLVPSLLAAGWEVLGITSEKESTCILPFLCLFMRVIMCLGSTCTYQKDAFSHKFSCFGHARMHQYMFSHSLVPGQLKNMLICLKNRFFQ
jgi:hypothetical protein